MVKKILTWGKAHPISLVASAFVAFLVFGGGIFSCNVNKWQGKIDALRLEITAIHAENQKILMENSWLENQNYKLEEDNKAHDANIKALEGKIKNQAREIATLEGEIAQMPVPEDCKPIVAALTKDINLWKSQFSLALADRDEWVTKYNNISLAYANRGKEITNLNIVIANKDIEISKVNQIVKDKDKQLKLKSLELKIYKGAGTVALIALLITVIK